MIEIRSTMKKSDAHRLMITALLFKTPNFLYQLLLISFVSSLFIWQLLKIKKAPVFLVIWLAVSGLLLFFLLKQSYGQSRDWKKEGPSFPREQKFCFNEDAFTYQVGGGRALQIPYRDLRRVSTRGGFLIFYMKENQALGLPRRDVGEKLPEIFSLLRSQSS